jgi:hypothetical protein
MRFKELPTDWDWPAAQRLLRWRLTRVDLRDVVRAVTGTSRLTVDASRTLGLQNMVYRQMVAIY